MAMRIGLMGPPNSGKSYSRKFIKNGEECFILAPSRKSFYLKKNNGEALDRLKVNNMEIEEMVKFYGTITRAFNQAKFSAKPVTTTGNWMVCKDIAAAEEILAFISAKMPQIKNIVIPDFTHYISAVLSQKAFIQRKAGGEAFQRFWELAGDVLNGFFTSIDELREDLVIVTEYHMEYDEPTEMFQIFTPGGKMLNEKFKAESYYDYMLYSHVIVNPDTGKVSPDDYKFVTERWGKYNARSQGIFGETLIPNNLQTVIDAVRKEEGIEIKEQQQVA
jgi:hypothetical protein